MPCATSAILQFLQKLRRLKRAEIDGCGMLGVLDIDEFVEVMTCADARPRWWCFEPPAISRAHVTPVAGKVNFKIAGLDELKLRKILGGSRVKWLKARTQII